MPFIILAILGVILVWVATTYNFFKRAKVRIGAAVQEIGNQLKRQANLIPNIVSSVKGYLKHEKKIFKDLTDARKAINEAVKSKDVQKMADAGSMLANVLPSIKVAVEDNPELKASKVVTKLMDELRDTADKVMYSRRLVIDLTADYNVKRVTLPSNIIAGVFKFDKLPGLIAPEKGEHVEVSAKDTKAPKIDLE